MKRVGIFGTDNSYGTVVHHARLDVSFLPTLWFTAEKPISSEPAGVGANRRNSALHRVTTQRYRGGESRQVVKISIHISNVVLCHSSLAKRYGR